MIEVKGLVKSYGTKRAVDGVTFSVEKGEVFTIIGPNGAGKTTIFNLMSRIYDPTDGRLVFEGRDITRVPPHRIASLGIARTFQNIALFGGLTVLDNLCLAPVLVRRRPKSEVRDLAIYDTLFDLVPAALQEAA